MADTDAMYYPLLLTLEEHQIRHIHDTYKDMEHMLGQSIQLADCEPSTLESLKRRYITVQGIRFKMQQLLNQEKKLP